MSGSFRSIIDVLAQASSGSTDLGFQGQKRPFEKSLIPEPGQPSLDGTYADRAVDNAS